MARSPYVWGIDIGRCALKALRCRISPTDPRKLVAEAYDYIEYPMIVTQPEADPVELARAALVEHLVDAFDFPRAHIQSGFPIPAGRGRPGPAEHVRRV